MRPDAHAAELLVRAVEHAGGDLAAVVGTFDGQGDHPLEH
jgi:hypothetical protein